MEQKLILASSSPRRKEILLKLNIPFTIIPADIDESINLNELPINYVERLSIEKAKKVANLYPNAFVIGSDFTCDLENNSIAKAQNNEEARVILRNFSGKTHFGRCGYAIVKGNILLGSGVASSIVEFKELTDNQIENYVKSLQWKGLAGAYGIQNDAKEFLANFTGSYFDLVGLPIYHIASTLKAFGFDITSKTLDSIKDEEGIILSQILKKLS